MYPLTGRESTKGRFSDLRASTNDGSRRWKEAVAAETASMSTSERMAWFRRQSSVPAIRNQALPSAGELVLGEDPGLPKP